MTEQKELLPERIWIDSDLTIYGSPPSYRNDLVEFARAQPAEDERQKLLEILVGELAIAIAEGYRPNLIDMTEAHRILKSSIQPAASTPTNDDIGEPSEPLSEAGTKAFNQWVQGAEAQDEK